MIHSLMRFISFATRQWLLCLLAGQALAQEDGLVAYWKFDEGNGTVVRDASGNGLDGTVGAPQWVDGKSGQALDFETGGYVEIPDSHDLRLDNDFTITAWVRKMQPSKKGRSMGIVSKSSVNAWDFDLFMSTSRLEHPAFYSDAFKAPEGDIEVISGSRVTIGRWHHIAVTRQGRNAKIFVDGRVAGTALLPETLSASSKNLYIGYDHDGKFIGCIDEVRIYERALSEDEIHELARQYTGNGLRFKHVVVDERFGGIREVADIDGDKNPDIVHSYWYDGAPLAWYAYRASSGWTPNIIRENFYPVTDNFDLADMDDDGDHDIIIAKSDKKKSSDPNADNVQIDAVRIMWFENPSAGGSATSAWKEHVVGDHYDANENYVKDIKAVDFTGDGRPEVVIRSNVAVSMFHQQHPGEWKQVQYIDIHPHEGMDTGDVDCDGDPDIVLNGFWFECPDDPLKDDWVEHNMDDKWWNQSGDWTANNCKVYVRDIDANGCADVLLAHSERPGYPISWYGLDRANNVWKEHVIDSVDFCHTLQSADMDLDGDIDVIAGEMEKAGDPDQISIFLNNGGGLKWTRHVVANKGIYSGKVADVDSDGDVDIIANRNYNKAPLEIWMNLIRE